MALAPTKFSSLTPAGTLDGTEIIAASQVVSGTLTSVKTTASAIAALAVSGPTSATDGNVAVFDGTTGKLIKDGGAPLVNPMTIAGDMIVGGTSGAASRFAAPTTGTNWTLTYVIGTGYVWSSSAATVAWGGITGTLASQTDIVAALLTAQSQLVGINDQTGTSYTLVLTDAGKDVRCNNASAITLTVPPNSSVEFAVGTLIAFSQKGAGAVTATAGSGVTVNAANGAATTAQYDCRVLEKTDTNTWRVW